MDLQTIRSLEEVDQERWDSALSGDAFYVSYRWLLARERTRSDRYGYILDRDGSGGVPYAVDEADASLFLGATVGNHNALPNSDRMLNRLLSKVLSLANEVQLKVRLRHCDEALIQRVRMLASVSLEEAEADAIIECPQQSFAGFMQANASISKSWRTERNRFQKTGGEIAVGRLSDFDGALVDSLLLHTAQKYGSGLSLTELSELRQAQISVLNDDSVVFMCYRDGEPIGCSIGFIWRGCLYQRVTGFNYERLANAFEYFNTMYYAPLDTAADRGYSRIHLGIGSLEAKVRRGANIRSQWHVAVP